MVSIIDAQRARKGNIIEDAMRWMIDNIPKTVSDETRKMWITNYIAAKYLLSERTAKDYANIIIMREKFKLPDIARSNLEIMASKGGYEGQTPVCVRAHQKDDDNYVKGDVAFVDESKDE